MCSRLGDLLDTINLLTDFSEKADQYGNPGLKLLDDEPILSGIARRQVKCKMVV